MSVQRVTPLEAKLLLDQGFAYLDVRSIPEYEQGHAPFAYNIPIMHFTPGPGMQPHGELL